MRYHHIIIVYLYLLEKGHRRVSNRSQSQQIIATEPLDDLSTKIESYNKIQFVSSIVEMALLVTATLMLGLILTKLFGGHYTHNVVSGITDVLWMLLVVSIAFVCKEIYGLTEIRLIQIAKRQNMGR